MITIIIISVVLTILVYFGIIKGKEKITMNIKDLSSQKEKIKREINDFELRNGYALNVIYSQIMHESKNLEKVIDNNYAGIKYFGKNGIEGKNYVNVITHEFENGKRVKKLEKFRKFENLNHFLRWYNSLIVRLYPESYASRKNPYYYYLRLVLNKGVYKYATDPKYSESVYKKYKQITGV